MTTPGWAGQPWARRNGWTYLPLSPDDMNPASAVVDWWADGTMLVPPDMCDRIIAAAGQVPPVPMAGDHHPDIPLQPDDAAGLEARAMAANRLWWRYPVTWTISAKHYTTGQHMMLHADWHPGDAQRRVTSLVQLSDPDDYRGGNLVISFGGTTMTAPRTRGALIALPAWTQHEVQPITSGARWSLCIDGRAERG